MISLVTFSMKSYGRVVQWHSIRTLGKLLHVHISVCQLSGPVHHQQQSQLSALCCWQNVNGKHSYAFICAFIFPQAIAILMSFGFSPCFSKGKDNSVIIYSPLVLFLCDTKWDILKNLKALLLNIMKANFWNSYIFQRSSTFYILYLHIYIIYLFVDSLHNFTNIPPK